MDNRSLIEEASNDFDLSPKVLEQVHTQALAQFQQNEYSFALSLYISLERHQTKICQQPNISFDNKRKLANYQMMVGECHNLLKRYPLGIESFQKAITTLDSIVDSIERKDDDLFTLGDCYNCLGLAYFAQQENYLAITAYENSLDKINRVFPPTERKLQDSIRVNNDLLKVLQLNENRQLRTSILLGQLFILYKQLGINYPNNLSKPSYWQELFELQRKLMLLYKIKSDTYSALLRDLFDTAQAWFNVVNYADTTQTQSFFNSLFVISDGEEEYKKAISDFSQTFLDSLAKHKPVEKDDAYWLKIAIAYLLGALRYTADMTQDPNTMRKYIINGLRALSQLKSFRPKEHEYIYIAWGLTSCGLIESGLVSTALVILSGEKNNNDLTRQLLNASGFNLGNNMLFSLHRSILSLSRQDFSDTYYLYSTLLKLIKNHLNDPEFKHEWCKRFFSQPDNMKLLDDMIAQVSNDSLIRLTEHSASFTQAVSLQISGLQNQMKQSTKPTFFRIRPRLVGDVITKHTDVSFTRLHRRK